MTNKLCKTLLVTGFLYTLRFRAAKAGSGIVGTVDDTMRIPEDKRDCSCAWSDWMNSGGANVSNGVEDETYVKLRRNGFEFCETPVDIQCYNHESQSLGPGFSALCDVNLGFTCFRLCDDYSIRVACCTCQTDSPQWRGEPELTYERYLGENVALDCSLKGRSRPTVQWFKNGRNFNKKKRPFGFKKKRKGQVIQMKFLYAWDSGNYTCTVGNQQRSISRSFSLTVQEKPGPILPQAWSENVTVYEGGNATFRCAAQEENQHISWYRRSRTENGIVHDLKILKSGAESDAGKLILKNVTLEDKGVYTCLASDGVGLTGHTAWLNVLPAPTPARTGLEMLPPANKTARTGEDVTFKCTAGGSPPPAITWIRVKKIEGIDHIVVVQASDPGMTQSEMELLKLENITAEDAGRYSCLVGNADEIFHDNGWLQVV